MSIASFDQWCMGAVNLVDYLKHFGIAECGFWGVKNDAERGKSCRSIWNQQDRRMLAYYLCEAQDEIENIVHYPLQVKWVENEQHSLKSDHLITDWAKVIAGGVRTEDEIYFDAPIDYTNDPAKIGPIATSVTDPDEIRLYYPDTSQEIIPDRITLSNGLVRIWVPRCRMVDPSVIDNPEEGLAYNDVSNFLATVDVVRVYNDPTTSVALTRRSRCNTTPCADIQDPGCIRVVSGSIGHIMIEKAVFVANSWVRRASCYGYSAATINYMAGMPTLTRPFTEAVIRLAHGKMPHAPCGCDPIRSYWERDMELATAGGAADCLFGPTTGAWVAWLFVQGPRQRMIRGSVI